MDICRMPRLRGYEAVANPCIVPRWDMCGSGLHRKPQIAVFSPISPFPRIRCSQNIPMKSVQTFRTNYAPRNRRCGTPHVWSRKKLLPKLAKIRQVRYSVRFQVYETNQPHFVLETSNLANSAHENLHRSTTIRKEATETGVLPI